MSTRLLIGDASEATHVKDGAVLPPEKAPELKTPHVQKPHTRSSKEILETPAQASLPETSGQTFLADLCRPLEEKVETPSTGDLHAALATGRSFRALCAGGDLMLVSKRGMDMLAYLIEQHPPPALLQATYAYSQLALILSLHARDMAPAPPQTHPLAGENVSCSDEPVEADV
jgi:hypothetical protein